MSSRTWMEAEAPGGVAGPESVPPGGSPWRPSMVSLVLVAHSAQLAEGAREVASQMAQGKVPIAAAGGSGDPENPLGTNAALISAAIQSVYSRDGVLVITDLGSALLSSEAALDLLPAPFRSQVRLSACPLVEGAVSAAVQAALGSSIDQVEAEAVRALEPKVLHLGGRGKEEPVSEGGSDAPLVEILLAVSNPLGLHARPAALFVATAGRFPAEVSVRNVTRTRGPANAKSINQLATLEVHQGDRIAVLARGPGAAEAISQLKALVEGGFGEGGTPPAAAPERPGSGQPARILSAERGRMQGIPASPGIALGGAWVYARVAFPMESRRGDNPQLESRRLEEALEAARQQIRQVQARILGVTGAAEAAIFDAHLLCLEDPLLVGKTRTLIFEQHLSAASAWAQAVQQVIRTYEALRDPAMRTRSADIVDVGRRVSAQLLAPGPSPQAEPSGPVILLAADLTPSDVATFNPRLVRGIGTVLGGPSSHTAILARAMGIPAIVGLDVDLLSLPAGTLLALDGSSGEVDIEPGAEAWETWMRRWAEEIEFAQEAEAGRLEPAITLDGHRVVMVANAGSLAEVEESFRQGAEGIGVLRTEFLFLSRDNPPGEAEQLEIYQAICDHAEGRPVVMRTLDAGGDKPIRYLDRAAEANPFLGQRGLRLSLAHPELFKTQVRALLRARAGHDLRILLPMVSTVDEVRQAKRLINEARAELAARGLVQGEDLPLGIMVEVPSAALLLDRFLTEIDFVSIGTNDLTQYALAAERGNPRVARLSDACHPAVLRLVRAVIEQSHAAGKLVSICGEVAADAEVQPVLVGLGTDELSMAASAIPGAKALVRRISLQQCRDLAEEATRMDSAEEVRELVRGKERPGSP